MHGRTLYPRGVGWNIRTFSATRASGIAVSDVSRSLAVHKRRNSSASETNHRAPLGVAGLARAKQEALRSPGSYDFTPGTARSRGGRQLTDRASVGAIAAATVGIFATGSAFYDGLWTPLLRDVESADEAAAYLKDDSVFGSSSCSSGPRFCSEKAIELLDAGSVVVIDGFLSKEELQAVNAELHDFEALPRSLVMNPKAQANNFDTRTDRVNYLREGEDGFMPHQCGPFMIGCHRLLRALPQQLEQPGSARRKYIVQNWTQLALYGKSGDFYRWHSDGLDFPSYYWLMGPVALYLYFSLGAVRRRSLTCILYLNNPDEPWTSKDGGGLHCRSTSPFWRLTGNSEPEEMKSYPEVAHSVPKGTRVIDIKPQGGRLVIFDSQVVEHQVAPTYRQRWAMTIWIHE